MVAALIRTVFARESEADARGQEHRLGLVGGHAGQPRAIAVDEADAAMRAAIGVQRHAGLAQRIDVPVHRPDRDLELAGELRRGLAAARLEKQQERDEA